MSTRITKTIDDLGIETYVRFEEDRKYFDEKLLSDASLIARQTGIDTFEPLLISEYQILFELGLKGGFFSLLSPPPAYNEQKKRLFTYQLAPKLGPDDLLELQMSRIREKKESQKEDISRDKEGYRRPSWEVEEEERALDQEANILLDLMQNIHFLNNIMQHINSERYRYNKG